tara:strand:+ start:1855 stop:2649 length:795 start_codon:yes stop_codon:yes gene_type:complete
MKKFISIFSTIIFILFYNSYAISATGPATVYKVTITKIELCTAVPLANEHDVTCTGATTVGSGSKTFDVASVSAGADVGSYVSTTGLPIGTTFTHARPTISRAFTIKGYAEADSNCFCRTESDSTYDSTNGKYKTVQFGYCEANATDAAANAEENELYLGTDTGAGGTVICGNAACNSGNNSTSYSKTQSGLNYQYGLAISDPDTSTDTFQMIFKLESPYTVGLTAPKIELAFGTLTSLYAYEWTDEKCFVDAYYPRSTSTITD